MDIKKCSVCGIEKKVDEFFKRRAGYDHKCKACRLAYNRERYQKTIAPYRKKYSYGDIECKVCSVCKQEKTISEFNLQHANGHGYSKYRPECKICQSAKARSNLKIKASRKIYNLTHKEELKRRKVAYLSNPENLEKSRAYAREYHRKNPQRQRDRLFKKYGITAQQYDEMFQKQNGGCAICGTKKNGKKMNFIIDHDHKTDAVRALLCTQCNAGLGNYRDSPSLLRKAAAYLESFNP
jgi:hypothetical protein